MHASFQLRSEFFPYTYTAVAQSCMNSVPLTRPMYLEYPEVEAAYNQPQEYLYGDNILVAPIAEPGVGSTRLGRQVVWFPPNTTWYDYFTGERFDGAPGMGTETVVAANIDEFPLYVRSGSPIPMRAFTQRMATDPLRELVVRIYPDRDGQMITTPLYEDDGLTTQYKNGQSAITTFTYARLGKHLTITISPTTGAYAEQLAERSYVIELPCTQRPSRVKIDGQEAAADYDVSAHITRIHIPARSIRQQTVVTLDAADADQSEIQLAAFARRAGIQSLPPNASIKSLLGDVLAHTSDPAEAFALTAAAHAGVFEKNDNPYAYPQTTSLHTYTANNIKCTLELAPSPALTIEGHVYPLGSRPPVH